MWTSLIAVQSLQNVMTILPVCSRFLSPISGAVITLFKKCAQIIKTEDNSLTQFGQRIEDILSNTLYTYQLSTPLSTILASQLRTSLKCDLNSISRTSSPTHPTPSNSGHPHNSHITTEDNSHAIQNQQTENKCMPNIYPINEHIV